MGKLSPKDRAYGHQTSTDRTFIVFKCSVHVNTLSQSGRCLQFQLPLWFQTFKHTVNDNAKSGTPTPPKHIYPRKACLAQGQMGFSLNSYISLIICDIRWALLSHDSHAYTSPITTGMKINLPSPEIRLPENMVSKLFFCCWFLGGKKINLSSQFSILQKQRFFFFF